MSLMEVILDWVTVRRGYGSLVDDALSVQLPVSTTVIPVNEVCG
jgi:hypothetical protein